MPESLRFVCQYGTFARMALGASSVAFAREPLQQSLWDEALPLLVAHWYELHPEHTDDLTPAVQRYQALDRAGVLRVFTARTSTQLLVGYALFTVTPSFHSAGLLEAQQDAIYLQPDCRGHYGAAFIDHCTAALFAEGIDRVYQIDTVARPLGTLLAHLGFTPRGTLWAKDRPVPAARRFPHIAHAEARG